MLSLMWTDWLYPNLIGEWEVVSSWKIFCKLLNKHNKKLAFVCHTGRFAPLTMLFGLTGAPGYFQDFIHDILPGRIGKAMAAYLDNIVAYTREGVDFQQAVAEILEILSKHNLWLKPKKYEFSRSKVTYMGLIISHNRI